MDQSNVPNDFIEAAKAVVGDSEWIEVDPGIRAVLAAVLPLYGQRVRAAVADELDANARECHDLSEKYLDERSGPLTNEAKYFATAASYIRSGGED